MNYGAQWKQYHRYQLTAISLNILTKKMYLYNLSL